MKPFRWHTFNELIETFIQNANSLIALNGIAVARSIGSRFRVAAFEPDAGQEAAIGRLDLARRRSFKLALEGKTLPEWPNHTDHAQYAVSNAVKTLNRLIIVLL